MTPGEFKTQHALEWAEFERWCKGHPGSLTSTWLLVHKHDVVRRFRTTLVGFVMTMFCNTTCEDVGSKKDTSDVDITIKEATISESFAILYKIQSFLKALLGEVGFKGARPMTKITKFFDLSFFITDFAPNKDVISRQYNTMSTTSANGPLSQYFYAFFEVFDHHHRLKASDPLHEYKDGYNAVYMRRMRWFGQDHHNTHALALVNVTKPNAPRGARLLLRSLVGWIDNEVKTRTPTADEYIDAVSMLSTLFEECYHTQGAYYHIVQCTQKVCTLNLTPQMLCASAIENLCFASTHELKRAKYLKRVENAMAQVKPAANSLESKIANIIRSEVLKLPTNNGALINKVLADIYKLIHT